MANEQSLTNVADLTASPTIKQIKVTDLLEVLSKGLEDFREAPTFALFLAIIYPVVGLVLIRVALGSQVLSLVFPLMMGFSLLGPVAAVGIYEISRRRERGVPISWANIFTVFNAPSIGSIVILGLFLFGIFHAWVWAAQGLYFMYVQPVAPLALQDFVNQILFTDGGHQLILVGNLVGFLFALIVFSISAVSFPLLLDRKATAAEAVVVSLRVVLANLPVMMVWAAIIALMLAAGSLPALVGLAVVIPVLGHASWHLYRKTVEY